MLGSRTRMRHLSDQVLTEKVGSRCHVRARDPRNRPCHAVSRWLHLPVRQKRRKGFQLLLPHDGGSDYRPLLNGKRRFAAARLVNHKEAPEASSASGYEGKNKGRHTQRHEDHRFTGTRVAVAENEEEWERKDQSCCFFGFISCS